MTTVKLSYTEERTVPRSHECRPLAAAENSPWVSSTRKQSPPTRAMPYRAAKLRMRVPLVRIRQVGGARWLQPQQEAEEQRDVDQVVQLRLVDRLADRAPHGEAVSAAGHR